MEEGVVRRYRADDRDAVREISWQTAFMGEPGCAFFDDQELLKDFLTLYFTDYEPLSCFVAEVEHGVVGYIVGAVDARLFRKTFFSRIFLRLLVKAFFRKAFLSKKNLIFFRAILVSLGKGEFRIPDFSGDYPATLHINLTSAARRMGLGTKLMETFLAYLKGKGVGGVHMATMSPKGASFFKKLGFGVLHQSLRSYFKPVIGRDIPVTIFGKKIKFE